MFLGTAKIGIIVGMMDDGKKSPDFSGLFYGHSIFFFFIAVPKI